MDKLRTGHRQKKRIMNTDNYSRSNSPNRSKLKNTYPNLNYSHKTPIYYFFNKLLKDFKLSLISFFRLYIKQFNARKEFLIKNILEKRNKSAKLIQENYVIFLLRKDLFSLAKKHKNYYSVYPSFITEINDKKKISIKLYTDLTNSRKYTILPLRFCLIRNCYVFDIPKTKFPGYKKIMRFNFVSDDNDRIIDPNYKKVIFGGKFVNEIDFKKFDKNSKLFKKKIKNISNSSSFLSDSDSDEKKKYNNNKGNMEIEEKITTHIYNKTTSGFSPIKYKKNKIENDLTNSTMSTKGSPRFNNEHRKRRGSILKESRSHANIKHKKNVSFGYVKFSY